MKSLNEYQLEKYPNYKYQTSFLLNSIQFLFRIYGLFYKLPKLKYYNWFIFSTTFVFSEYLLKIFFALELLKFISIKKKQHFSNNNFCEVYDIFS